MAPTTVHHGGDAEEACCLFHAADEEGAVELLHGLSGMASILQATEFAHLAAAAEHALLDGKAEVLLLLFDELQLAMQTLRVSLDRFEAMTCSKFVPTAEIP